MGWRGVSGLAALLRSELAAARGHVARVVRGVMESFRGRGVLAELGSGGETWSALFQEVHKETLRVLESIDRARPRPGECSVVGAEVRGFVGQVYDTIPLQLKFPPAWVPGLDPIPSDEEVERHRQICLGWVEAWVLGHRRLAWERRLDLLLRSFAPVVGTLLGVYVGYVLRQ